MTRQIYTVLIVVIKSPNDVFNDINNVSEWWPEEFEGENTKLNDEFVFKSGDTHYSKNRVIEYLPNKKVAWLVTDSIRKTDNYSWTGTKMIFELTSQGSNTMVKFTYDGFIFANEYERLVQICDITIKEMLFNFVTYGKVK
ncbi:MAG: SRPBCC domain-containing protein [Bacteroidota bacterium]|nr:SRPBCC domain-containing protein [Bacteroidota bacterium]